MNRTELQAKIAEIKSAPNLLPAEREMIIAQYVIALELWKLNKNLYELFED